MIPDTFFRLSLIIGPEGPFYFGPYLSFNEATNLAMENLNLLLALVTTNIKLENEINIKIEECIFNMQTNKLEIIDVRFTEKLSEFRVLK